MGMFLRRGVSGKLAVTITLIKNSAFGFDENIAYVMVNGVKYCKKTVLEVYYGTVIGICVGATSPMYEYKCRVTIDGELVQSGAGIYRYTVLKPSTLEFGGASSTSGNDSWRSCAITRG